jgi:hypothetical protein
MASRLTHQVDIKTAMCQFPLPCLSNSPQNVLRPSFPARLWNTSPVLPCIDLTCSPVLPCIVQNVSPVLLCTISQTFLFHAWSTCRGGRKRMLHLPPNSPYHQKLNTSVSHIPVPCMNLLPALLHEPPSTTTEVTISTKRANSQ